MSPIQILAPVFVFCNEKFQGPFDELSALQVRNVRGNGKGLKE